MLFQHFISFTAINVWSDTPATCPIRVPSVVFLAVLQTVACKTNQGYKCLFTCLPTELVSQKSQATAIFINTENGEVQNHSGKTSYYVCINKLHMVLSLQVIFTRVVPMCCKVFSVDIQIATSGAASWKYLFFLLFLSLLAFQVSSCNCYSFRNHLKEDSGIQVQTLTKVQNCLLNIPFTLPSP